MRADDEGDVQVLIPFSLGLLFGRQRADKERLVCVLIPFSLGLLFGPGASTCAPPATSLNPFFVRSAVRSLDIPQGISPDDVLIPFSLGLLFGRARGRRCLRGVWS